MLFTKHKFLITCLATACALSASAWDHMFLMGPGVVTGYDLGNAAAMNKTSENPEVFQAVMYLDNKDGRSFRMQPDKDWVQANYYGPAVSGEQLTNNTQVTVSRGNDSYYTVATPGVYLIKLETTDMKITIFQMDEIFMVGDGTNAGWNIDNGLSLRRNGDIYSAEIDFKTGAFKYCFDKGHGLEIDGRKWMFFKDWRGAFKTSLDDTNWTVGYRDNKDTDESNDVDPGRYRVTVNTADKSVRYTRLMQSVSLDGGAVLKGWDKNGAITLTKEGDVFKAKHVYFTSGDVFKPVVDGRYYGSDTWANAESADNSDKYLRDAQNGSDLYVNTDGFRSVEVGPSPGGDGTLYIRISAPQSVWLEGFCSYEFDSEANRYFNNELKWIDGDRSYKMMIDGDEVATLSTQGCGWYSSYITFDGCTPKYDLTKQVPSVHGEATGDISFSDSDISGQCYIKNRVYVSAGKPIYLHLGIHDITHPALEKSGYYDIRVNLNADGIPQIKLAGPVEVNMPLSPEDFANGQKHYFLVGQRMGAWRLQPEWEFTPDEHGTLSIPDRLLYNGYVMVGVVDNYDDYIAQRYRAYSDVMRDSKIALDPTANYGNYGFNLSYLAAPGNNGCADGKFTSTRYNDIDRTAPDRQHGSYEQLALDAINIYSADGHGDQAHLQSPPSRVSTITLNLDNEGNPSRLTFNNLTTDPMEVARLRTFALCGGGILNHDVPYIEGVQTSPLNNQPNYSGNAWSDAWIQYDAKGKPYVDAHGEFIYQTSFTENWLRKHPSYFNFDGIEYTSNNITFFINEEVTHDPQFGQRTFKVDVSNTSGEDDGTRREVLYTYFNDGARDHLGRNSAAANNLDDAIKPTSKMVCYEVSDMWMEGMFKIWSGWGGSATNYEYETNETNYTRWFLDNAGHGAWRQDCTAFYQANTNMAYTLFEDMDAANFGIGYGTPGTEKVNAAGVVADAWKERPQRLFFKRVRLWYNLDNGLVYRDNGNGNREASFLVFYQEQGAPRISIAKHGDTQIKYTFDSPLVEGMNHDADARVYGNITHYKIECVWIKDDGSVGGTWTVTEGNLDTPRHEFGKEDEVDPRIQAPGRYYYRITTKRANTGDQIYTSNSNILRIDGDPNVTAIGNVATDHSDALFTARLDRATRRLDLWSTRPMGRVTVWAVNGALMTQAVIDDTEGSLDLQTLTPGVYIVNALNTSSRFIIR